MNSSNQPSGSSQYKNHMGGNGTVGRESHKRRWSPTTAKNDSVKVNKYPIHCSNGDYILDSSGFRIDKKSYDFMNKSNSPPMTDNLSLSHTPALNSGNSTVKSFPTTTHSCSFNKSSSTRHSVQGSMTETTPPRQILFRSSPKTTPEKLLALYTTELPLTTAPTAAAPGVEPVNCSICMSSVSEESPYLSDEDGYRDIVGSVSLTLCSHVFHAGCLLQMATQREDCFVCPNCSTIHGTRTGTQPKNGTMNVTKQMSTHLPGYRESGTICVDYNFPAGCQGPEHPHPGRAYHMAGFPRVTYFPDNPQGNKVVALLKVAFERRLVFTVGTSATTGADDSVVWNDIHHKTEIVDNFGHGYPDPGYLDNVTSELASVGVTEEDIACQRRHSSAGNSRGGAGNLPSGAGNRNIAGVQTNVSAASGSKRTAGIVDTVVKKVWR